tara:strand:+ start:361 stop:582 length:222 start_codon:yes stop_codon:yes gene_type:complete
MANNITKRTAELVEKLAAAKRHIDGIWVLTDENMNIIETRDMYQKKPGGMWLRRQQLLDEIEYAIQREVECGC